MVIENPNLEHKFNEMEEKIAEYLKANLSKEDERALLKLILK